MAHHNNCFHELCMKRRNIVETRKIAENLDRMRKWKSKQSTLQTQKQQTYMHNLVGSNTTIANVNKHDGDIVERKSTENTNALPIVSGNRNFLCTYILI